MSSFVAIRSYVFRLLVVSSLFLAVTAGQGAAASLQRARVSVNALDPKAPRLEIEVTVSSGTALSELELYLAAAVEVETAASQGARVEFESRSLSDTGLKIWTFHLPQPISAGSTGTLTYTAVLRGGAESGIRAGEDGGHFLPGSGWFPATEPWSDALVPHSTNLELLDGMSGLACGARSGAAGPWTSADAGRPYVVWGRWSHERLSAGDVQCDVYRRSDRDGDVPQLAKIGEVIHALQVALGDPCGRGDWAIIDVGHGALCGGQRALFWDESMFGGSEGEAQPSLEIRDLAGALATAFWTECLRFRGELAAWLSRGMTLYLGDVSCLASYPDYNDQMELSVIGSRRSDFMAGRGNDHALSGLVPHSADADRVLGNRGALVAHMAAEAVGSRSMWMNLLRSMREEYAAAEPSGTDFLEYLLRRGPGQDAYLKPLLETADLPDFRIASHGPAKGRFQNRYRIEVENTGRVEYGIEVGAYSHDGYKIRSYRLMVAPGAKRAVLFKDPDRIGSIALDPRGFTLQSELVEESIAVTPPSGTPDLRPFIPAFEFTASMGEARAVTGFELELEGITILDFEGYVLPWRTYHGPSGAALMGEGRVRIAPKGEFAAGFQDAMGQGELHYGAADMWIRFPLATWEKIEPQLRGVAEHEDANELKHKNRRIHTFSFSTHFFEDQRAQIPPPGSSLAIFTTKGKERLGLVREPLPDGRVHMSFWDHLHQDTLWEETH